MRNTKNIFKRVAALVLAAFLVITMMPASAIDTQAAAKKPAIAKSVKLNVKAKKTLKIAENGYTITKVTAKSSKKTIASVKASGKKAIVITGKKSGNAQITTSIVAKKGKKTKTIVLKTNVTVKKVVKKVVKTAADQAELEKALKTKKLSKLTIKTSETAEMEIPSGTYSSVDLIVDAPNATIINNGTFKTITIKAIAAETWHERGSNNNINVKNNKPVRIIVETLNKLASIIFSGTISGTNTLLVNSGTIGSLSVANNDPINVQASGSAKIESIDVSASTSVDVTAADGAEISKVEVNAGGAKIGINTKDEAKVGEVAVTESAAGTATEKTTVDIKAEGSSEVKNVTTSATNSETNIISDGQSKVENVKVEGKAEASIGGSSSNTTTVDVTGSTGTNTVSVNTSSVTVSTDTNSHAAEVIDNNSGSSITTQSTGGSGTGSNTDTGANTGDSTIPPKPSTTGGSSGGSGGSSGGAATGGSGQSGQESGGADNSNKYIDASGQLVDIPESAIKVTNNTLDREGIAVGSTASTQNATAGTFTWIVIDGNVSFNNRINVLGTANIVLKDGFTLNANAGITVNEGATLNIFGQSGQTGTLNATGAAYHAGIGSFTTYSGGIADSVGTITINGGKVIANGGSGGAGIGGGKNGAGGTITINGGTVIANGASGGAGIGGGDRGAGGTITINRGVVKATGGNDGYGIGGGYGADHGTLTIAASVKVYGDGSSLGENPSSDKLLEKSGPVGGPYTVIGARNVYMYAKVAGPVLSSGTGSRTSETAATISFTSDVAGQYYVQVVADGADAPTFNTTTAGTAMVSGANNDIAVTLTDGTGAKDIYVVGKDSNGIVGQAIKIDVGAYVVATKSISGKVYDYAGTNPRSGITVKLYANDDHTHQTSLGSGTTNAQGEYTINHSAANGMYDLVIAASQGNYGESSLTITVGDDDLTHKDIYLRLEDGTMPTLSGATVSIDSNDHTVTISISGVLINPVLHPYRISSVDPSADITLEENTIRVGNFVSAGGYVLEFSVEGYRGFEIVSFTVD